MLECAMNTFVALCALGAEKILGNEIKLSDWQIAGGEPGRVYFCADNNALYEANFRLRTCDRVYLMMAKFPAITFDELFEGCYKVDWQDFFFKDVRVVVDKVRAYKSPLKSEHSIQSVVQKAIYTKLGDVWHMRTLPETGDASCVRVYMERGDAVILLDTSGEPLHKRGWRVEGGTAPLRETVAAAMLQATLWRRKIPLVDPFCASGTIPIEATLFACNAPAGLCRHFAYENLAIYDHSVAQEIKRQEIVKIRTDVHYDIQGSDIDPVMIDVAKANAEAALSSVERALEGMGTSFKLVRPVFTVCDFAKLKAQTQERGLILCNPPFGKRLGERQEAEDLYKKMGTLAENFFGWTFAALSCRESFQECFGKKASEVKRLRAGNLNTSLYIYR